MPLDSASTCMPPRAGSYATRSETPARLPAICLTEFHAPSPRYARLRNESLRERAVRAVDLIIKKRDGGRLTRDEIRWLIHGYVAGDVPDYQMAAWAMAVVWRGMDDAETTELTLAMAES